MTKQQSGLITQALKMGWEELDLSNSGITRLHNDIGKLKKLRTLDISNNRIQKPPSELFNLQSLESLFASNCDLREIPNDIKRLKRLKILDVSNNQLRSLPWTIGLLQDLELLDISSNMIELLPDDIGRLNRLRTLNIRKNDLSSLPPEIGKLANLNSLFLAENKLESLPEEILGLINLATLALSGNPLPLPPEILEKINQPKIILNYYFRTESYDLRRPTENDSLSLPPSIELTKATGKKIAKPLNETKLILVGQGSVGKTSLVERILHNRFDQNETKTEGISINKWGISINQRLTAKIIFHSNHQINLAKPLKIHQETKIKINVWDLGGQEIMHATHQFFLTKRSLYLLVLDARLTQEENRVEYWLKIIQSFGGDSPVLIVGNKTDQHPLDIDRTGLQKKYPNIVSILETSAATGAGVEALKAEIAEQTESLPHIRDLLPGTWYMVKSKLEELGRDKNFITQDEYLSLCDANDVTDETSQHTLIGFLHDLGVVLHFQDDRRLAELGILNPQWVTNGVYKILNYKPLFENKGLLTLPMLDEVLSDKSYPKSKRLFIVDMMKKFELCYDIEPDKSFLIPDLLPKDEIYTGEWDDALAFQYHYNVLPSSIITRFIVRMNAFIHKNTIWRSGVVLKRGDNTALVKADTEDRKVYIWVSGKEDTRRDLLAMIRGEFDAIHKTIAKIEAVEKVPLTKAPEADPVSLSFLQQLAVEGRDKLVVQAGSRIVELIVKEVLGQIEKEGKGTSANMVVNIQGNVYGSVGNNNTVNFVHQKFEPIYEAIESSSRDATEKTDLVAEVDEIKAEVAKGDEANESFLSRRLRNLKKMAPDIADIALATLANPAAGLGMIVRKVAKKVKEETK